MSLTTLGTSATTSLKSLAAWSESLSDADIGAIAQSIANDRNFASILGGGNPGASGILATGDTHTSTTLDDLTATAGGPLSSIQPGYLVLGADIPAGTFVARVVSSTSVVLSQAATGSTNDMRVAFMRPGPPALGRQALLRIPNRGILKVLPGDRIAIDNTGWPVLVSGASIGYAGTLWV